jgi:hypothetical protein
VAVHGAEHRTGERTAETARGGRGTLGGEHAVKAAQFAEDPGRLRGVPDAEGLHAQPDRMLKFPGAGIGDSLAGQVDAGVTVIAGPQMADSGTEPRGGVSVAAEYPEAVRVLDTDVCLVAERRPRRVVVPGTAEDIPGIVVEARDAAAANAAALAPRRNSRRGTFTKMILPSGVWQGTVTVSASGEGAKPGRASAASSPPAPSRSSSCRATFADGLWRPLT